ncbi:metallopeptidase TldD-related protein [Buchnera aphidicola (Kurisakia onigurumii)]|uniref:metallopeptidase TldD-related protein n=1 Tax=Buchnera aphidicola TaxID=9 RepID=UPI0031B6F056
MNNLNYIKKKQTNFQEIILFAIKYAKNKTDEIEISIKMNKGINIQSKNLKLEKVEFEKNNYIYITVYINFKKGTVCSSDLSINSIKILIKKAILIASYTENDNFSGLADIKKITWKEKKIKNFYNVNFNISEGFKKTIIMEKSALNFHKSISHIENASFNSNYSIFHIGNSTGLLKSYSSTFSSIFISVIAKNNKGMQQDNFYSITKDVHDLEKSELVGIQASKKSLMKLSPQKIQTTTLPVILKSDIIPIFFSNFIKAINGYNVYNKKTFLLNYLEKKIFPNWMNIQENPFIKKGLGSKSFDDEGINTKIQFIVKNGILKTWLLDSYSGKKLNYLTTGHAGTISNWIFSYDEKYNLKKMMKIMNKGILITELMGDGVNIINGDFSYGISGFLIENGKILHPISENTISGNLINIFLKIVKISNDINKNSKIKSGSILFSEMKISGLN